MSHAFVDSGERQPDKAGRMLKLCAECGRTNVGTAHTLTSVDVPTPVPAARRKSKIIPREIRLLALAAEAVLDLPMDTVGWSVWVRTLDLRKAIGIPFDPQSHPLEEVPMPKPAPIVISDLPVERLSGPVRARAKVATKAIRDPKMREIATRAVATGWLLRRTENNHYQLEQGAKRITFAGTPSDKRAWLNFKARAKRHGIDVSD